MFKRTTLLLWDIAVEPSGPIRLYRDVNDARCRAVVLAGATPEQQRRVSGLCRKHGCALFAVATFGYDG